MLWIFCGFQGKNGQRISSPYKTEKMPLKRLKKAHFIVKIYFVDHNPLL